jgi:endonuclease G, mitochondrial
MNTFKVTVLSFFLVIVSVGTGLGFTSSCPEHFYRGVAPQFINQKLLQNAQELCNMDYVVMYSGMVRVPLYAAEHLTRKKLDLAKGLPRVNNFRPDERLPVGDRAELRDFARSGYDRGHLAPSADMSSSVAQDESFLLSNVVPQDPENNRNLHEAVESVVRKEARKRGELYVVTGVFFAKENVRALKGRVYIPSGIYKAVYDPVRNEAAAYVEDNAPGPSYKVISVRELADLVSFDVFPGVSVVVKSKAADLPAPKLRR